MRLAHITDYDLELYIGSHHACDSGLLPDKLVKFCIFHEEQSGHCSRASTCGIRYRENCHLQDGLLNVICEISKGCRDNKIPLFIHCAAGLGRTPLFATLALASTGVPHWKAIESITKAMWEQYEERHAPCINGHVLTKCLEDMADSSFGKDD